MTKKRLFSYKTGTTKVELVSAQVSIREFGLDLHSLFSSMAKEDWQIVWPTQRFPIAKKNGCSAENYTASIPVEAGKTYLFRIINAGGLVPLNFAIANHNMTVVRADGTYVEPFELTSLEVNLAQRYSVLVNADQDPDTSYWAAASARGLVVESLLLSVVSKFSFSRKVLQN